MKKNNIFSRELVLIKGKHWVINIKVEQVSQKYLKCPIILGTGQWDTHVVFHRHLYSLAF